MGKLELKEKISALNLKIRRSVDSLAKNDAENVRFILKNRDPNTLGDALRYIDSREGINAALKVLLETLQGLSAIEAEVSE